MCLCNSGVYCDGKLTKAIFLGLVVKLQLEYQNHLVAKTLKNSQPYEKMLEQSVTMLTMWVGRAPWSVSL